MIRNISLLVILLASIACSKSAGTRSATAAASTSEVEEIEETEPGPLFWKVRSSTGKISYILATISYVSAEQLLPEIWEHFDKAEEILLEQDINEYFSWILSQDRDLEKEIGTQDFQQVMIQIPYLSEEALRKSPAGYIIQSLGSPDQAQGESIVFEAQMRAKEAKKKTRFLVADHTAYYEAFTDMEGDIEALKAALHDYDDYLAGKRTRRLAYLQGSETSMERPVGYSDLRMQTIERTNEPWLDTLAASFDRGQAFAVISAVDLLSENGLLLRLKERGYEISRAYPGREASRGLPTLVNLKLDECITVLRHILKFTQPPEVNAALDDPIKLNTVLAAPPGRQFLMTCRRHDTKWYDCATDATSMKEAEKCDKKFPATP